MSEKLSMAKRVYWANISPEERSKRASLSAKLGWAKKTKEERMERCQKMIKARMKEMTNLIK